MLKCSWDIYRFSTKREFKDLLKKHRPWKTFQGRIVCLLNLQRCITPFPVACPFIDSYFPWPNISIANLWSRRFRCVYCLFVCGQCVRAVAARWPSDTHVAGRSMAQAHEHWTLLTHTATADMITARLNLAHDILNRIHTKTIVNSGVSEQAYGSAG